MPSSVTSKAARWLAVPAVLGLLITACGGGGSGDTSGSAHRSPQPTATAPPTATAGPTKKVTVALDPANGGTIEATLTLTIAGGSYTLHLEGRSLHFRGSYLVNIHAGTCASQEFSRAQEVGHLVGDGSGNGLVERTYGRAYVGGGIITIHGYTGSGDEFSHIACAELPAG